MRVNDRNFIESEVHNAWAESEKPGNRVGRLIILGYESKIVYQFNDHNFIRVNFLFLQ
jgi:hypothetical protein